METILELKERLDGLISSIKNEDIEDHEFISHKYNILELHAHTERSKLENMMQEKAQKLALKKQYNMYMAMEALLVKKAYESNSNEMYAQIKECQKLVNNYAA